MERDDTDTFLPQKSLPRLPSTDDAYDIFHPSSPGVHSPVLSTPLDLGPPPPPPPSTPYTPSLDLREAHAEDTPTTVPATTSEISPVPTTNSSSHESSESLPVPTSTTSSSSTPTSTLSTASSTTQPPTPLKDDSQKLLMALRHNFHQIESDDSLNETGALFIDGLSAEEAFRAGGDACKISYSRGSRLVGQRLSCCAEESDWGSIIAYNLRYSSSSS